MQAFIMFVFILWGNSANILLAGENINASPEKEGSGFDHVVVAPNGIIMPLGLFAIIKEGDKYCAAKFIETWKGKKKGDAYASIVAYYQGDGSGDFNRSDLDINKDTISFLQPKSIIGRLAYTRGDPNIYCGDMAISTSGYDGSGVLYFNGNEEGYGIAPTPWKNISDVNVFESGLKWFKENSTKQTIKIPIDVLLNTAWREPAHDIDVRPIKIIVLDADTGKPLKDLFVFYTLRTSTNEVSKYKELNIVSSKTGRTDENGEIYFSRQTLNVKGEAKPYDEDIYINIDVDSKEAPFWIKEKSKDKQFQRLMDSYSKFPDRKRIYDDLISNPNDNFYGYRINSTARVLKKELRADEEKYYVLWNSEGLLRESEEIVVRLRRKNH